MPVSVPLTMNSINERSPKPIRITPTTISTMVNASPRGDSGCTSPNPTVVRARTVMYKESRSDHPSMSM